MLSVSVACKLWGHMWKGKSITIYCDNLPTVCVINAGKSKDVFLLKCLMELCFISAVFEYKIRAVHLTSKENRLSDLLSRWNLNLSYQKEFKKCLSDYQLHELMISEKLFTFSHKW